MLRKAHKNRLFVLYPLRDKINIFIYPAIFGVSRWLPFEGENKEIYQSGLVFAFPDAYQMGEKFSKSFIKSAFSCSTTWEGKFFAAKARFLVILVAYLLREEKYFFSKGLIFSLSRDLPLEGRKIYRHPAKWLSPLGISEEKNNSIKAALFAISRWLLFGGIFESNSRGSLTREHVKKLWIFRKTPPKMASPTGNK